MPARQIVVKLPTGAGSTRSSDALELEGLAEAFDETGHRRRGTAKDPLLVGEEELAGRVYDCRPGVDGSDIEAEVKIG